MIKLTAANCPNCGADIEVNPEMTTTVCKYCGSTILVDGAIKGFKRKIIIKDETYDKGIKVSQKLNEIMSLYIGNKNEMLLMLKDRIGLVSSNRTTAKIAMMRTAHDYKEETYTEAFKYRVGEDRTLERFEYKSDGSVEATYDIKDEDFFALEYYGKITKFTDLDELLRVLDEIIEEVKIKFNQK